MMTPALPDDEEIAAGNSLDGAKHIFAQELAVHHRDAPVASALQLLAELEGVAEEAQVAADPDVLVLDQRQAVVAGGGRAGEDALADAVDQRLLQGVAAECEEQQADAGPAVRRLVGGEGALDGGLGVAADDRRGVAGRDLARGLRPGGRLGGDDQPGRRHREGFGEGVLDGDFVDGEQGGPPVYRFALAVCCERET
jgi:hypothetical protein